MAIDTATAARALGPTLLRAAWLSILLGIGIELSIVFVAFGLAAPPSGAAAVADGVQKVSWSVFVCVGLALGMVARQMGASAAGLAGLLSAPLAFIVARAAHKSVAQVLDLPAIPAAGPSPALLASVKGVEYAALGLALWWISRRPWGGMGAHAAAGTIAGAVFGGAIVALTVAAAPAPPTAASLLPRILNELIFPIGCALVLYVAGALPTGESDQSGA